MSANNLHLLIKSLSSTEKGYIKKQAGVHVIGEQNKYIKLFDLIDKQKDYDEKEIVKKFRNDPILNNFAVAKNYLFRFIMKALESYHTTVKSELRSTLNQVDILYNKNLPAIARKMLAKAKATAHEYELYEFMEQIIDWEIVLLVEEATPANYLELVNKYFNELYDSIDRKKTIIGYKHLYQKLRAKGLYRGFARNDEDVIAFRHIIDEAERNVGAVLNTFNAQFFRNLMQSNYLFMINEQEEANTILNRTVDLLDKHPHMVSIKPFTYLGILRNKAVNELSLMKYQELFDTLGQMDKFVAEYGHLNKNYELLTENLKLFVYIPTGQFEKSLAIAKRVDELYRMLPVTRSLQKEKQLQEYAFAYIYIGLGDYRNANHHINVLLNDSNFDLRSDLFCFAHILSLIIHFEMKNHELLEYRIRSTYRLLLRRNKLFNFEKLILSFLKTAAKKKNRNMNSDFTRLLEDISGITGNKIEQNALSLFDLSSWLESKIENKSFAEIKQQKFNRLMAFESQNAHLY